MDTSPLTVADALRSLGELRNARSPERTKGLTEIAARLDPKETTAGDESLQRLLSVCASDRLALGTLLRNENITKHPAGALWLQRVVGQVDEELSQFQAAQLHLATAGGILVPGSPAWEALNARLAHATEDPEFFGERLRSLWIMVAHAKWTSTELQELIAKAPDGEADLSDIGLFVESIEEHPACDDSVRRACLARATHWGGNAWFVALRHYVHVGRRSWPEFASLLESLPDRPLPEGIQARIGDSTLVALLQHLLETAPTDAEWGKRAGILARIAPTAIETLILTSGDTLRGKLAHLPVGPLFRHMATLTQPEDRMTRNGIATIIAYAKGALASPILRDDSGAMYHLRDGVRVDLAGKGDPDVERRRDDSVRDLESFDEVDEASPSHPTSRRSDARGRGR